MARALWPILRTSPYRRRENQRTGRRFSGYPEVVTLLSRDPAHVCRVTELSDDGDFHRPCRDRPCSRIEHRHHATVQQFRKYALRSAFDLASPNVVALAAQHLQLLLSPVVGFQVLGASRFTRLSVNLYKDPPAFPGRVRKLLGNPISVDMLQSHLAIGGTAEDAFTTRARLVAHADTLVRMGDDRKEPTQTTDKGLEIPVPKRADWDDTLRKIAKPAPRPDDDQD